MEKSITWQVADPEETSHWPTPDATNPTFYRRSMSPGDEICWKKTSTWMLWKMPNDSTIKRYSCTMQTLHRKFPSERRHWPPQQPLWQKLSVPYQQSQKINWRGSPLQDPNRIVPQHLPATARQKLSILQSNGNIIATKIKKTFETMLIHSSINICTAQELKLWKNHKFTYH